MGCYYSKLERKEMVSRCKARKRYMKQFVKARHAFSASHSMYLKSLRNSGAALLQFATAESPLQNHHPPPQTTHQQPSPPLPPPPPPPMSPTCETWTTTTSTTNTSSTPLPPPPPPPPSSTWDFWDPFMQSSERVREDEWEETSTTAATETVVTTTAASVAAPPSVVSGFSKITVSDATPSEMPVVVSTKSKDLVEIIKELDEYFLRAADSGGKLSALLEVPTSTFHDQTSSGKHNGYGKSLNPFFCSWNSSQRFNGFMNFGCDEMSGFGSVDGVAIPGSHCSTVERLYEWERKLYEEIKNAESLKIEHERKTEQLRKLELKRGDYVKTEKAKKEVEKLESRITVSAQAIESISQEIIKLRESELYPQLVELVKGLMCMWRSLYESHQVQTHIVQQLKYINAAGPSTEATTEIHRQSTLQLELELQQWHLSFCNLVKSQRDYIQSLTGWLRLSLFQFSKNPSSQNKQDSAIYTLCEEWQLAIDNAPDKVASEGIKALLTVVHAIVVQQSDEQKQKRKSDSIFKELEKKMIELRALESKYGPGVYSGPLSKKTDKVSDKRAKVEALRARAEEEKAKYEKSIGVTRAMTLNNLQMGLPHVFQAVTGFSNVWTHAFESVCNQAKILEEVHDVKRLMN
uniref:protein ALTERED PHOSPHATE STARVATION RESPONSE 1-like n=1 Tax=Erigeron canadensis TaxID=72917 RepID=UPI001CB8D283|nr:protein ALTERED PHOSPHATE STARVATION RESPONSE 1-like [Erigeron canadensis]